MRNLRWLPLVTTLGGAVLGTVIGYAIFRYRVWTDAWSHHAYYGGLGQALFEMVALPTFGLISGTALGYTIGEMILRCREEP